MGTTLVAICCKGGVVVGADTRTSVQGYVSNRYALKLTPLSPRIVVCRSGSAADTQRMCDEARWELEAIQLREGRSPEVSQVAKLLRSFMVDQNLSASLLCAGCTVEGQGRLYSILPSGALLKHDRFAVSGSGSTYIMGHLDHALSDDLLSEEEAVNFVAKSVQLAMDRDGSSGGFVRICSITSNGIKSITVYPSGHAEPTTAVRELPGFASIVPEES
jgi:20S proteasome subunit beta 1